MSSLGFYNEWMASGILSDHKYNELHDELAAWDAASDEALENFERRLNDVE